MVFRWLKRKVSGDDGAEAESSVDPNSDGGKFLLTEARPLDKLLGRLGERVAEYLLTGRDEAVLDDLRKQPDAADHLGLKQRGATASWRFRCREFFKIEEPEALVRLGHVYATTLSDTEFGQLRTTKVPLWLETLLWEACSISPSGGGSYPIRSHLSARQVCAALEAAGESTDCLLQLAIAQEAGAYHRGDHRIALAMKDLGEFLDHHTAALLQSFEITDANLLRERMDTLKDARVNLQPFVARLAELACDKRKTVHGLARQLLDEHWEAALPKLQEVAVSAKPAERLLAIELLAHHGGSSVVEFLTERQSEDNSKKVQEAIADRLQTIQRQRSAGDSDSTDQLAPQDDDLAPPNRERLPAPQPLDAVQRQALQTLNTAIERNLAKRRVQYPKLQVNREADLEAAIASIEELEPWPSPPTPQLNPDVWLDIDSALLTCCRTGSWSPIQLLRLIYHTRHRGTDHFLGSNDEPYITAARDAQGADWELRDLADAVRWVGYPSTDVARAILSTYGHRPFDWGDEKIWPLFHEALPTLAQSMRASEATHSYSWMENIENAFDILKKFPRVPRSLIPDVWQVALGTTKRGRISAQDALSPEPDLLDRVTKSLTDGRQDVRTVAAQWVGRLGDRSVIPALEATLAKEKSDLAKAAQFSALEALGCSIDQYIDRDALAAEAAKGLKKPPKGLDFAMTVPLPEVAWAESGEALDPEVLRWWMLKSAKLKAPTPDPVLRLYISQLREQDRLTLGEHVLRNWIHEDTRKPVEVTPEVEATLRQQATQWQSYYPGHTVEEIVAQFTREHLSKPIGSATKVKGVLAVAAACGGPDLAAHVQTYLKTWYGLRAPQCKSLLAMLAWVNEPSATQVLLSTATRFRTKGIREEADRLVREVAERRGWTMDELADRTLPSAGFESDGTQEVAYLEARPEGMELPEKPTRTFTLALTDDLTVQIRKEDGGTVKSLPAARQGEDEGSVKDAKKTLSQAKKMVKQIVAQQQMRLREGMCSQRNWTPTDWRQYLLEHPVVGRLCRRVIWTSGEGDGIVLFRPLDDGTLTDVDDEMVTLDPDHPLRIAHGSLLTAEVSTAWQTHLADYEIEPLLQQFPVAMCDVPDELANHTDIDSFEGHIIGAFKLRGAATKRDFVRGEAEDGGWFMTYHKPFPTLQIDAVLEFTGNPLPEEDRETALLKAYFTALEKGSTAYRTPKKMRLDQVPSVLLSEIRADLAVIMGAGSGYDPDWQKKTEY